MTTNWTRRAPCESRTLERAPGRLGMIRPLVGAVARPASRHRVSLTVGCTSSGRRTLTHPLNPGCAQEPFLYGPRPRPTGGPPFPAWFLGQEVRISLCEFCGYERETGGALARACASPASSAVMMCICRATMRSIAAYDEMSGWRRLAENFFVSSAEIP